MEVIAIFFKILWRTYHLQGKCTKFSWVIHEIFLKANKEEKTALDTYFATEKPFYRTKHTIPFNLQLIWLTAFVRQTTYYQQLYHLCLTTFDFTSFYANISYHDTTWAIIMSWKLLNLPNFYRDYLLNLNKNKTLLLLVIAPITY